MFYCMIDEWNAGGGEARQGNQRAKGSDYRKSVE